MWSFIYYLFNLLLLFSFFLPLIFYIIDEVITPITRRQCTSWFIPSKGQSTCWQSFRTPFDKSWQICDNTTKCIRECWYFLSNPCWICSEHPNICIFISYWCFENVVEVWSKHVRFGEAALSSYFIPRWWPYWKTTTILYLLNLPYTLENLYR